MHIKFKIHLEDGTFIESHDNLYNNVKDHAHVLPPHNDKKWVAYELITDTGVIVGVDFRTGIFMVNGNVIHPATSEGQALTNMVGGQDFGANDQWSLLNGLPYFPVVGRRNFKGDNMNAVLYFCGWKRKDGDQTVTKMAFIYPNGAIVLT